VPRTAEAADTPDGALEPTSAAGSGRSPAFEGRQSSGGCGAAILRTIGSTVFTNTERFGEPLEWTYQNLVRWQNFRIIGDLDALRDNGTVGEREVAQAGRRRGEDRHGHPVPSFVTDGTATRSRRSPPFAWPVSTARDPDRDQDRQLARHVRR